jgi:hypothetical protein
MKSTAVYKGLHAIVGPWCKANGFTRLKLGWLVYQKSCATKYLTFWFQCDLHGWDKYSGSSFAAEFQEWVDLFEGHIRRHYRDPEAMMEGFWLAWKRVDEPYRANADIWMRYWEEEDVIAWGTFVLGVLPRILTHVTDGRG